MFVPSSACEPYLVFVSSSLPIMVSSSLDDDNKYENTTTPSHLPPDESIEHEPTPTPQISRWFRSTREEIGDLAGNPSD
jgi:hypothetical protein